MHPTACNPKQAHHLVVEKPGYRLMMAGNCPTGLKKMVEDVEKLHSKAKQKPTEN